MKKIIFLCVAIIVFTINIYAIRAMEAQEKVKKLFQHEHSEAKNPSSLTGKILIGCAIFHLLC